MFSKLIEDKNSKLILSCSIAFFTSCCGFAVLKSSDLNLETANAKISLVSQVSQAKDITNQLQEQARSLEVERSNYRSLKEKYDELVMRSNSIELKKLSPEIRKIESTPNLDPEDISLTGEKIDRLQEKINNNN